MGFFSLQPMRFFWTVYRFIQILSLDIVGGALACTWMLASYLEINLAWQVYTLLGLAVFSIYTLDHQIGRASCRERV